MDYKGIVAKRCNHCWHCGRKLRGKYFAVFMAEGHERVFHKSCLKIYREEEREAIQINPSTSARL